MNAWRELPGLDGFAWPWMLLAIVLPLLVHALVPVRGDCATALRVPWGERLQRVATSDVSSVRVRGLSLLGLIAWSLLCVAAARPQQLGPSIAPPQAGRDMMLAVDLSASMGEEDMQLGGRIVDRLTAAKAALGYFLDRRVGDRVGLVVFGDRAYTLTPLTLDRDSVRGQLGDSVIGLAGRATAIGDAIALATKRLQREEEGQRVLILLTDGVNTAGTLDPIRAAQVARDYDIRIHAIAFGGEGGGLSVAGFKLPMGGDEMDEAGLQRIAALTGGRFFRARDANALAGIYAEIDRLEPVQRQGRAVRPKIERYPLPLAAALGFGLLALGLRRRA